MKTEILRPNELLYLLDIFLQALGSTTSFVLIKEPFQNQAFIHSRNMTDPPVGEFPYKKDWDVRRKFYGLKQPRLDFWYLIGCPFWFSDSNAAKAGERVVS